MQRILIGLGGLAAIGLIGWFGAAAIGHEVWQAAWVVPLAIGLHAVQLLLSASAWRGIAGGGPGLLAWWRIRWVREAVNSLLPVAQLGGNVVAIRLLARDGVTVAQGSAATTLDIAVEAVSQAAFTLAGIGVLAAVSPDRHWLPWFAGGTVALLAGLAGFAVALRAGLLRLVERIPGLSRLLGGMDAELRRLAARRAALLRGGSLHLLAWLLGTGETWLALAAMGLPPSLPAAFVIESLAMAARSAAFAVPGALGVQEAGFILVAGLFGIPPETAVALSMVKRARELLVGIGGLLAWNRCELANRRDRRRSGATAG